MKYIIPTFLAISALSLAPAKAQDCVNADPWLQLGGIQGDFELTVDPQDPAQNLIYASNVGDGASTVVAAKVSGSTGKVMVGSLTTVANNFYGLSAINGPEFVQKPTGELGIVYAGHGGVHAVFRPATPANWHQFSFDVGGRPTFGTPPALSNSSDGAYPTSQSLEHHTFGQKGGECEEFCYGVLDGGRVTDVWAVLAASGFIVSAVTQSPRDGYIYLGACDATHSCGLYEAAIDDAGGFVEGTFQKLAATGRNAPTALVAARHPVTGSTVIFANRSNVAIDIGEQSASGGPVVPLTSVPTASGEHYRAVTTHAMVVLTYLIRSGAEAGTYTLPVTAIGNPVTASGSALVPGSPKRVSTHAGGAELSWLPAANKWAIFYRTAAATLMRCWLNP